MLLLPRTTAVFARNHCVHCGLSYTINNFIPCSLQGHASGFEAVRDPSEFEYSPAGQKGKKLTPRMI